MKLIIASNNRGKVREYRDILAPFGFEAVSQGEAGIRLEVEETGATFEENARLKARAVRGIAGCCVIADDSGLEVEALGGEPGLYSARYKGLETEHERRMAVLQGLEGADNRRARFVTCICLIDEAGGEHLFTGTWNGEIATEEEGTNGFGYDPIFISEDGNGRTTASLPLSFKETYSHRAKAVRQMTAYLASRQGMGMEGLREILLRHRDTAYADFTAKLIPTVPREKFIGIRSPEYKKIIREIGDDPVIPVFLSSLPHELFEENCLHAALINRMKDYGACVRALEAFMPYIDNWAVNDMINPACFRKHRAELTGKVQGWIASEAPYTRRCGMRILMANYLDGDFRPELLDLPADLRSDAYYVNMMTAWLFAEALVKQWDTAVTYIEGRRLDPWTHNMAIRKACESFRIPDERKAYLRTLRAGTGKEQKT